MTKNIISTILDYFMDNNKEYYREEILRARDEFTKDLSADVMELTEMNEDVLTLFSSLFNEWFFYNYRLKDGTSIIDEYLKNQTRKISVEMIEELGQLQDSFYTIVQIKDVVKNKSMLLYDYYDGREYWVKEKNATHFAQIGDVTFARIVSFTKGDTRWFEMVGSDVPLLPTEISDSHFQDWSDVLSYEFTGPKFAWELFISGDPRGAPPLLTIITEMEKGNDNLIKTLNKDLPELTEEQAYINLSKMLRRYRIEPYVDLRTLKQWLKSNPRNLNGSDIVSMLTSLLPAKYQNQKVYDQIMDTVNSAAPHLPFTEDQLNAGVMFMSVGDIPYKDKQKKAIRLMNSNDYPAALRVWEHVFRTWLNNKISSRKVFSALLQKAECHYRCDEAEIGKALIKRAAQLYPQSNEPKDLQKKLETFISDQSNDTIILENARKRQEQFLHESIIPFSVFDHLSLLKSLGINVSVNRLRIFISTSNLWQVEKLVHQEYYSNYTGSLWEEELVYLSFTELWLFVAPEYFCADVLWLVLSEIEGITLQHNGEVKSISKEEKELLIFLIDTMSLQVADLIHRVNNINANDKDGELPQLLDDLFDLYLGNDPSFVSTLLENFSPGEEIFDKLAKVVSVVAKLRNNPVGDFLQVITLFSQKGRWKKAILKNMKVHRDDYQFALLAIQWLNEKGAEYAPLCLKVLDYVRKNLRRFFGNESYGSFSYLIHSLSEEYKKAYSYTDEPKKNSKVQAELEEHLRKYKDKYFTAEEKERMSMSPDEATKHLERILNNMDRDLPEKEHPEMIERDYAIRYCEFLKEYPINFAVAPEDVSSNEKTASAEDGGKVGRNDPCPCGSGKKYKKCCW